MKSCLEAAAQCYEAPTWSPRHLRFVTIKQLGNATEDEEVKSQRKVVAYFVAGVKARNSDEAGSLWAYEDSFFKVGSVEQFVLGHALGRVVREIPILPE